MKLLGQMIDSNLVKAEDYEMYFSKFLIEAKQELKKQSIAEKKKAIAKAEQSKTEKKTSYDYDADGDGGNANLSLYATLLLPYWDKNASVPPLIQQMLRSNDKQLKYNTMLLMLQHNKPYPDTLLKYFAGLDDYCYKLYTDLKDMKKSGKFPEMYNNHLDMGRSYLLNTKLYGKPDSVVYMDRLKTEYKGKMGYIYFYKYKNKKDDLAWKLATAGLVPENPRQFEFEDTVTKNLLLQKFELVSSSRYNKYEFTEFTDTRIDGEEPMSEFLKKQLKKMLYSRRKSAKEFYKDDKGRSAVSDYSD